MKRLALLLILLPLLACAQEITADSDRPVDRDEAALAAQVQQLEARVIQLEARIHKLEHPKRRVRHGHRN